MLSFSDSKLFTNEDCSSDSDFYKVSAAKQKDSINIYFKSLVEKYRFTTLVSSKLFTNRLRSTYRRVYLPTLRNELKLNHDQNKLAAQIKVATF